MIKQLVIAAAFAGSLTIGVQPASASAFVCMQKYTEDMVACGESLSVATCQMNAEIQYTICLQALYPIKDPIDNG